MHPQEIPCVSVTCMNLSRKKTIPVLVMALDPHSFFADPDPAIFLNADPDPALKSLSQLTL